MPRCKSCKQPIQWVVTQFDKKLPIDPEPHPNGNIMLKNDGAAVVVTPDYPGTKYLSHFATCPNAKQHRKARTQKRLKL